MLHTTNSGLRRYLSTTITAFALASIAAGLTLATAGTASADDRTPEESFTAPLGDNDPIPNIDCPGNAPYLVSAIGGGGSVPNGVDVIAGPGVGVYVEAVYNVNSNASGVRGHTAIPPTNSDIQPDSAPQQVTIRLHCTSNRDAGYFGPQGDYGPAVLPPVGPR